MGELTNDKRSPKSNWMSRAALLGLPAAAFLAMPGAHADVVVKGTSAGSWVGADPGATTAVAASVLLTGQASVTLIMKSVVYNTSPGFSASVAWASTGGGSVTGVSGSGIGSTLPSNTTGWSIPFPVGSVVIPTTVRGATGDGQRYIGIRVNYASAPTQHVWVAFIPGLAQVTINDYGSFAAAGGGGTAGGGPGGAAGTPEPAAAGLALLALGAAGVLRHKRREQVA